MVELPAVFITHFHHIRQFHPHPRQRPVHHDQNLETRRGRAVIQDVNNHSQWKNSESCALASLTNHFMAPRMLALVGSLLGSLVSSVKTRISSGLKFQFSVKVMWVVLRHVWGRIEHIYEEPANIPGIIHTTMQCLGHPRVIDSNLKRA